MQNANTVPFHVPLPLHNENNAPFHTATVSLPTTTSPLVHSTGPKALPSVTHVPLLSRRSDFNAWNNGVRSLIFYLGYLGHIANSPGPGVTPRPDHVPSFPPILSGTPSVAELAALRVWWEEDNVVAHILTSRLTTSVLAILLFDDDDNSIAPHTARTIYELLRQLYSVHDHTSSSALYSELCNLQCGACVLEYITKWHAGIT